MILELQHIYKNYDQDKLVVPVLKDVSLQIDEGEYVAIMGPSGSGKTTLMNIVGCLDLPTSGTYILDGRPVSELKEKELTRVRRDTIGFVFQNYALFRYMTVYDNVAFGLKVQKADKKKIDARVRELIKLVGLEGLEKRYPSQLSGGQRQRVGIARSLAANPDILLMDEPFGAVDEITRKMLQNEIARIHITLGVTIVFITHDIKEALKLGTLVLVMNQGRLEQKGTPEEIMNSPGTDFVRELVQVS